MIYASAVADAIIVYKRPDSMMIFSACCKRVSVIVAVVELLVE
jgi:hypothetical protein